LWGFAGMRDADELPRAPLLEKTDFRS
jgi:hypothetical protein